MQLKNTIDIQIKESMLNKNKSRLIALRAIKSAILLIEKSGEGADLDEIKLLMKLIKQRKDSLKLYLEQNRQDLANTEQVEIDRIEEFLPKQLTESEIKSAVSEAITEVEANSIRDMGKVMGLLKNKYAGQMDFGAVGAQVKNSLSS